MAVVKSFELNGNKQSFANWISNLSPVDTPFTSMIGKESIDQTQYSWQTDTLAPADNTPYQEGSQATSQSRPTTEVLTNFTSILRVPVNISPTADAISTHGRRSELSYQMAKAGKEIMRDLEWMNLSHVNGNMGSASLAGKFAGFEGLVGGMGVADADTGAVIHKEVEISSNLNNCIDKNVIFDMTYNLYLSGSKANKIMYHPKYATAFSLLIGENPAEEHTYRMFDNLSDKYNAKVRAIRDPLGRTYTLIPNRFMPEDKIFFFNENDWTQMVLQAPRRFKLANRGSGSIHVVEMEVGLRHKHPYASGVLSLKTVLIQNNFPISRTEFTAGLNDTIDVNTTVTGDGVAESDVPVYWHSSNPGVVYFARNQTETEASGRATNQLKSGNRLGTATVWCVSRGVKSQVHTITTYAPIIELSVSEKDPIVGGKSTLTATVKKFDDTLADKALTVNWYVNPSDKFRLDSESSVLSSGVATVEGTCLEQTTVLVQASIEHFDSNPIYLNYVPTVSSLSVDILPNAMTVGGTSRVVIHAMDHEGNPVVNTLVSWQLSDTQVATTNVYSGHTDASGVVEAVMTGNATGSGILVARSGQWVTSDATPFTVDHGFALKMGVDQTSTSVGGDFNIEAAVSSLSRVPVSGATVKVISTPSWPGGIPDLITDRTGKAEYTLPATQTGSYEIKLQLVGSNPLVETNTTELTVIAAP